MVLRKMEPLHIKKREKKNKNKKKNEKVVE